MGDLEESSGPISGHFEGQESSDAGDPFRVHWEASAVFSWRKLSYRTPLPAWCASWGLLGCSYKDCGVVARGLWGLF